MGALIFRLFNICNIGSLYLRCELEADIFEVLLSNSQRVACISKEYIAAMLIDGHIGVLAALEISELSLVVRLYPACLVDRYRLPATLPLY